jgi:hypothetical protein
VKIDKAQRGYVRYVRGLREKYPVEIIDENLRKMISAGEASGSEST